MTPEQEQLLVEVRALLKSFTASDKYVFNKLVQLLDGKGIQTGRSNGTTIATEADQKLGFWGKTPVIQPAAISSPSGGATVDAQARTALIALLTELHNAGIIG